MLSSYSRLNFLHRFLATLLAGFALVAASSAVRADDQKPQPPSLTDDGHDAFSKLGPLVDAKNYDAAIDILNQLIAKVPDFTYDRMLADDTLAKLYWQGKNDPQSALNHFEHVQEILAQHPEYFDAKDRLDHLQYMAEIYYVVAEGIKSDKALQQHYMDRSIDYLHQWLTQTRKPRADDEYLYATLLFYKAMGDPEHIDLGLMKQAREATERALELDIKPRDSYYHLLAYECQATGDFAGAASYLELLTTLKPNEKDYWSGLVATYSNIQSSDTDQRQQRIDCARMINALERAQARGYMTDQKDNQLLVSLYLEVQQYGKATELMEQGLHSGAIEDKVDNWEYLAESFEQTGSNLDAIRVLKEGEQAHPDNGDLDALISEIYSFDYNSEQTYAYAKRAVEKGHLSRRFEFVTYQRLAYAAYELGKYDEALQVVRTAMRLPGGRSQGRELKNFESGIIEQIKEQKRARAAAEGALQ